MNELEKSKTYYLGDFIIRMTEDGILRVTSDMGIMSIHPSANNSIIIESKKH